MGQVNWLQFFSNTCCFLLPYTLFLLIYILLIKSKSTALSNAFKKFVIVFFVGFFCSLLFAFFEEMTNGSSIRIAILGVIISNTIAQYVFNIPLKIAKNISDNILGNIDTKIEQDIKDEIQNIDRKKKDDNDAKMG